MKYILQHKTDALVTGISALLLLTVLTVGLFGKEEMDEPPSMDEKVVLSQSTSLLPIVSPETPVRVATELEVIITAYSSTPEQTDDTPFITASGNWVRDGIVATNLLPFGTKIRIPDIYGEKVFVVDDRMHPRKNVNVDIWFPTYWQAKSFGVVQTHIEVLEG